MTIESKTKNEIIQNINLLKDYIFELPPVVSCLDCESWDHQADKCGLYNIKPPAVTIVKTCEKFVQDIPF